VYCRCRQRTGKTIEHALKRWPPLQRYAGLGSLPINKMVENAIRHIAIGKKNWLFAGAERAGRGASAVWGPIHTRVRLGSVRFAHCLP
jgi:hypothetical protein